jgi:hypothetical protein
MRERFLALYCLAIGAFTFIVLMVPGSGGTQSAYAYPKAAFTPPKPNMGHEPVDDQDQRGASDTAQSSVGKGYLPAGGTPTPPPSCGSDADYIITQSTGAIIDPGTTLVPGSQCNQPCTSTITLPFPYRFYGQIFTQIIVGENGTMAFTANPNTANNTCLPRTIYENAIMPHWDDLDTRASVDPDLGIYVSTRGSPPSRIFNIEWRACRYGAGACDGRVNFEVRLFENLDTFEIIYGEVANSGNSATGRDSTGHGPAGQPIHLPRPRQRAPIRPAPDLHPAPVPHLHTNAHRDFHACQHSNAYTHPHLNGDGNTSHCHSYPHRHHRPLPDPELPDSNGSRHDRPWHHQHRVELRRLRHDHHHTVLLPTV